MNLKNWILKHWIALAVIAILLFAAGLRFYQLGNVPHGLTWDEAAIGYNGFAIWTIHRDEWLQLMPISFKSFGDYKAPLAIYITGLFTVLLGMDPWVIRLVPALSGVVGVGATIWLTWELLQYFGQNEKIRRQKMIWWSLLSGLLLAIMPWHIHLTRFGMETGQGMAFIIIGTAAWFRCLRLLQEPLPLVSGKLGLRLNPILNQAWLWQVLSIGSFAMSLYSLHSAKITTPILGLGLLWISRRQLWQYKKLIVIGAVLVSGLLAPLVIDSVFGSGAERLSQAVIKTDGKTQVEVGLEVVSNFALHFSPEFLVFPDDTNLRHSDGEWGVLLWPTFILVMAGVIASALQKSTAPKYLTKITLFSIFWLIAGTIPSAIGQEVPHANHALIAAVGWVWLAVIGLDWVIQLTSQAKWDLFVQGTHGETKLLVKSVVGMIILAHALFLLAYLHDYYTSFATKSADAFQDGYLETFEYILPFEKGDENHPEVEKIIIDNGYGQPYIYALLTRRTNPIWYHGGSLIKYEFPDTVDADALLRSNAIIVATGLRNMPWEKADKLVYGTDGQIRFGIFVNHPDK